MATSRITGAPMPDLARFAAYAAPDDTRLLSKQGEVDPVPLFHRGYKYELLNQHLLRNTTSRFKQENIKAHLDLKEALKNAAPQNIALQAFSLLSPAAYRGEPLTRENIGEVIVLLTQLKVDPATYSQLKQLFDQISRDPRLQVCLEQQYPGKMDGLGKTLLHKVKRLAGTTGIDLAINMLLPGIGTFINAGRAGYQVAQHCDYESHHHQVAQASRLPGRASQLAHACQQVLSQDHASIAVEEATKMTLGAGLAGLSDFGVPQVTTGVATIVAEALPVVASKALTSGLPAVTKMSASYLINQQASDLLQENPLPYVLPRLEMSNDKGEFSFSMLKPASVRALLTYLGPRADESLLGSDAPTALREMEQARLALKAQLGSPADEQLLPGQHEENAPTAELKLSHKVFKKLLAKDYNWLLPAVRSLDKGAVEDLNSKLAYKVPLEVDNRTVYLEKSPNLSQPQLDALKVCGAPSQLKLIYLAEGWL
ncbi:hypothetical protein P5705_21075 [Pseudomonas entomophila]|uniref:hypothetical protein n=1 Tax=Pseudomonas entomophila TaxID=312306 RepID=UPI0024076D4D|nr:hypothetical protein [Pseudomonas entomophila]MDF9620148.1 hypothetical protein [Pseudomonas entomophila]